MMDQVKEMLEGGDEKNGIITWVDLRRLLHFLDSETWCQERLDLLHSVFDGLDDGHIKCSEFADWVGDGIKSSEKPSFFTAEAWALQIEAEKKRAHTTNVKNPLEVDVSGAADAKPRQRHSIILTPPSLSPSSLGAKRESLNSLVLWPPIEETTPQPPPPPQPVSPPPWRVNDVIARIAAAVLRNGCRPEQLFHKVDLNSNGMLSWTEFERLVLTYEPNISITERGALFSMFDKDKSGNIDMDEFCQILADESARASPAPVLS